jgi:xanthine dehydrogenase YagT iron-sulfur-binding subunit
MPDVSNASREDQARGGPGFNRRDFLKGSSVAVAATAAATAGRESAAQQKKQANVVPARPAPVKLEINGQTHTVTVEPRVTLLDVLRDDLNLTGAKEVCDTTNCGACTVIIDGKAVYACSKLAHECQGKKITTVEGLSSAAKIDEVARCFVKHDGTQCGFCTPGFVVAVRAFVDANPGATAEQINKGLGGNICRCGTYHGVLHAALECAKKGGK